MNAHENFEETVVWLLHKNVEDGTPCLMAESYNKCRLIPGLTKSNIKDHQQIRMRLPGHYIRHDDEAAKKLVLWQPTKRRTNRGDVGTGELLPVCYYNELPRKIWEAALEFTSSTPSKRVGSSDLGSCRELSFTLYVRRIWTSIYEN